ncbi:hypothetical protein NFI96_001891 [Prochilodus magdalenae]|nr:hypothetical protein NFI96_001891 [Prochilodus magdalenae]
MMPPSGGTLLGLCLARPTRTPFYQPSLVSISQFLVCSSDESLTGSSVITDHSKKPLLVHVVWLNFLWSSAENDPPPTSYLLCGGPVGVLTIEEQGNTVHRETDGLESGPVHLQSVLSVSGADTVDRSSDVFGQVERSVQLDIPGPVPEFEDLYWLFNGTKIIVTYDKKHKHVTLTPSYKHRVEFNEGTYSLTLKNLQKTDSGLYEARASGDVDTVVAEYRLSVLVTVWPGCGLPGFIKGSAALVGVEVQTKVSILDVMEASSHPISD